MSGLARTGWWQAIAGAAIGFGVYGVLSTTSHAQVPGGVSIPGTSRPEIGGSTKTPPKAADGPVARAPAATDGKLLDEKTDLSFKLLGVDLRGSTIYKPGDFDSILENYIGKNVTLAGLREIGNRIERKYRTDGYVATRVIVPPQAIRGGKPVMQIFEGKIIHYEINGEIGAVKKHIARLLDNLLTDKPATWSELERYLLLARDLPGISLTGTLRSAGDSSPGGVILVVDTALKAVDALVSVQNRNADPTGPWTVTLGVSQNSKTRFGERLGVVAIAAVQPIEQASAFALYEMGLGDEGLRLKLAFTQGQSEPRDDLFPLNLSAITTIGTAQLEFPIVRSRRLSLWTRGGLEFIEQRTSTRGVQLFDDAVRVMFAGVQGIWFTPIRSSVEFDIQFRKGIMGFGAPDRFSALQLRSRFDAEMDFSIVKGQLKFNQKLPPWFELGVTVLGQHASKPLPSIEEMSVGELTIGRGFEPGAVIGDSGFGYSIELRFKPPSVEAWWLNDLKFYTFYDYAQVWDRGNPTAAPNGFEFVESVGIGARFQMFNTLFGDIYLAIPKSKALSTTSRRPHSTVKFTITKFF